MRTISATLLFAIGSYAADRAAGADAAPPAAPAAVSTSTTRLSPVLRPQEPDDNRFVRLPGPPPPPPRELKDFTPPPPPPLPQAQLPSTAAPTATLAVAKITPKLSLPDERPILRRAPAPKPVFPPDFERDSAAYCQARIGAWTEPDVYNLFGKAIRRRIAGGDGKDSGGLVFAFADPTGNYREIELDFAADTGLLRSVFAYPWQMTWSEAQRTWGTNVTSAQANKGRIFYSYVNRRLDVLVDPDGKIVSLGLY